MKCPVCGNEVKEIYAGDDGFWACNGCLTKRDEIYRPITDPELKDAIAELGRAQHMVDTATNSFRINEAIYRINAAQCRIKAIEYENRLKKYGRKDTNE